MNTLFKDLSIRDIMMLKESNIFINELYSVIENLKKENKELETIIQNLKTTNELLLLELKKFENLTESMGKGRNKIHLNYDLIKNLKEQGISNVKIAQYLGVSEGTVRNRLKGL